MEIGQFCFLLDKYYTDFPDDKLMRNKEVIDGISHNRPCFFAFKDNENSDILWLVPVSSKYEKYRAIYDKKIDKYGKCNTIRFGEVLGKKAAFLIQNICPVTDEYIQEIYVDKNNVPIDIDHRVVSDVVKNAREVLAKQWRGANIIFPNVLEIHSKLIEQQRQKQLLTESVLPILITPQPVDAENDELEL